MKLTLRGFAPMNGALLIRDGNRWYSFNAIYGQDNLIAMHVTRYGIDYEDSYILTVDESEIEKVLIGSHSVAGEQYRDTLKRHAENFRQLELNLEYEGVS